MAPQIDLLKRLVLSKFPITIIQTEDCHGVVALFRRLGQNEKRSFFYWQPHIGIHLLSNPEESIPNTKTLTDALHCIERSQHFGQFILDAEICDAFDDVDCTGIIQKILKRPGKSRRKVFIIGKHPSIPNHLKPKIIVIRLSTQYTGQVT